VHASWPVTELQVGKEAQHRENEDGADDDQGDPDGTPSSGFVYVLSDRRWMRGGHELTFLWAKDWFCLAAGGERPAIGHSIQRPRS
jgi:hypothetical protein